MKLTICCPDLDIIKGAITIKGDIIRLRLWAVGGEFFKSVVAYCPFCGHNLEICEIESVNADEVMEALKDAEKKGLKLIKGELQKVKEWEK